MFILVFIKDIYIFKLLIIYSVFAQNDNVLSFSSIKLQFPISIIKKIIKITYS